MEEQYYELGYTGAELTEMLNFINNNLTKLTFVVNNIDIIRDIINSDLINLISAENDAIELTDGKY